MSEGSPEICIQKHTAKERNYTLPKKFTYENILSITLAWE